MPTEGARKGARDRAWSWRGAWLAVIGTFALTLLGGIAAAGPGWTVVPAPSSGATNDQLAADACVLAPVKLCKAVGYSGATTAAPQHTFVLSSSGGGWIRNPSPNVLSGDALTGVSCVTSTFCKAVGYYFDGTYDQPLIIAWSRGWARNPSPPLGAGTNELLGVSCASVKLCFAVGETTIGTGPQRTLIEEWNGSAWHHVTSPSPGGAPDVLNGVSCASVTLCKAVGTSGHPGQTTTLIESFNGHTWSLQASPNGGNGENVLYGVACAPKAAVCKAVGYDLYYGGAQPLIESWRGAAWAIEPSVTTGGYPTYLTGDACPTAKSCRAVGYTLGGGTSRTFIEGWTGATWVMQTSPNRGSGENSLDAIACFSAAACRAAGDWAGSLGDHSLLESQG